MRIHQNKAKRKRQDIGTYNSTTTQALHSSVAAYQPPPFRKRIELDFKNRKRMVNFVFREIFGRVRYLIIRRLADDTFFQTHSSCVLYI